MVVSAVVVMVMLMRRRLGWWDVSVLGGEQYGYQLRGEDRYRFLGALASLA